jgi:hypothetical protein
MRIIFILLSFACLSFSYCGEEKNALGKQLMDNSVTNYNIAVKLCTRAVLYRLNGGPDNKDNPTNLFPLRPYGNKTCYFSKQTTVKADDYDRFRALFSLLGKNVYGEQYMCHNPAYGLRLYGEETLIFETSLCFECKNWYIPILHTNEWVSLPGGDDDAAILTFFQSYFPE